MADQPRVIKAHQISPSVVTRFNTVDTLKETEARVDAARSEIERLRETADAEIRERSERELKEGFEKGYQDGLAAGRKEALEAHRAEVAQEVEERIGSLTPALAQFNARLAEIREQWLGDWETMATDLICGIAARVVRHEIAQPNEIARRTLNEILGLVGQCPEVTVYLHPTDADTLSMNRDALDEATNAIGKINIVADEGITPGGCRLTSQFGAIDATIEKQLARIEQEMTGKPAV